MQELIARLERATGPDFDLDVDIAVAVAVPGRPRRRSRARGKYVVTYEDGRTGTARPPSYTYSIDAALTLAPDGFQAYVDTGARDGAHACVWTDHPQRISGGGRACESPALALCIAALRARAASA